ncbi:MAG: GAF domain-containing protein [Deltaproteobacteria bacterium]|nr:GAF domain-containing protein [Deltaproteobacteria bacterium]
MNKTVVHCRKCGRQMNKERTDFDHIHWVCDCGFRDRTPYTRMTTSVNPYQKEDIFARIRFKEGGDVMFEVSRTNDSRYELMSLDEITRLVSSEIPLPEILDEIAGKIARRMKVEVCSVYLNKGGQLVLSATHGLAKEAVGRIRLAIGEGITGAAAKAGKPVAVHDAASDPRYRHFAVAREEKYKAMLSYPVLEEGGRAVAVINVQTVRARSFTPHEIGYIAIVANLIRACLRMRDKVRDIPLEPPPDGR